METGRPEARENLTHVAVVYGGTSAEREVSVRSGHAVLAALDRARFEPLAVEITLEGAWSVDGDRPVSPAVAAERLLTARVKAAFLALHGPGGEDGSIQGFFEVLGLPYTGSGVQASSIAIDKVATRSILTQAGLCVPPAAVVSAQAWDRERPRMRAAIAVLGAPVFVKAPRQGSSYGVVRVAEPASSELDRALDRVFAFGPTALVERGVEGVEVTVAVLGNAGSALRALPPVEIRPRGSRFFDTDEKYSPSGADEHCPPISLTEAERRAVEHAGLLAHGAIGCDGFSRTDMIVASGRPIVLETNTIPGLTNRSLLPLAAAAAGIEFRDLLSFVLDRAFERAAARRAPTHGTPDAPGLAIGSAP